MFGWGRKKTDAARESAFEDAKHALLHELEEARGVFGTQMAALGSRLEDLNARISSMKNGVDRRGEDASEDDSGSSKLSMMISNLESSFSHVQSRFATLEERLSVLENRIVSGFFDLDEKMQQKQRQERRQQVALETLSEEQRTMLEAVVRVENRLDNMENESVRLKALMKFAESFALFAQTSNFDIAPGALILRNKLAELLAGFDLALIAERGALFDPAIHEACQSRYDPDFPENTVLEIVVPGFLRSGKVLRCAMVVVNRASDPSPR